MADDRITQDDPNYVPFFERANIRPKELAELRRRLNGAVKQIILDYANRVCCPNCMEPVGNEIILEEQTWLRIGNLQCYAVHGQCVKCDAEFHWTVNDVRLARLISKRKD